MAAKRKTTKSGKPKPSLPRQSSFDWKKELRKDGFKISRNGKITKEITINWRTKYKPKELTPAKFAKLQKKSFVDKEEITTKITLTKDKALNLLAKNAGFKNIAAFFDFRKTDKYREFEIKAKNAGVDSSLTSNFLQHLKAWKDVDFENRSEEAFDVLHDLHYVDYDDIDRYVED